MAIDWNLVSDIADIEKVVVFSGGACNIRDAKGKLLRNQERDDINNWLSRNDILFYDPQIHPDTHGVDYDYEVHQPLEVGARKLAKVNLFEISPRTFGGATALEIAVDEFRYNDPSIIFFSDGNHDRDVIPAHSTDGYPLFVPYGIHNNDAARKAHYEGFIRGANRMRKYLMHFAEDLDALTITFGEQTFEGDIVISPKADARGGLLPGGSAGSQRQTDDYQLYRVGMTPATRTAIRFSSRRRSPAKSTSIATWTSTRTRPTNCAGRLRSWCGLTCFPAWCSRSGRPLTRSATCCACRASSRTLSTSPTCLSAVAGGRDRSGRGCGCSCCRSCGRRPGRRRSRYNHRQDHRCGRQRECRRPCR